MACIGNRQPGRFTNAWLHGSPGRLPPALDVPLSCMPNWSVPEIRRTCVYGVVRMGWAQASPDLSTSAPVRFAVFVGPVHPFAFPGAHYAMHLYQSRRHLEGLHIREQSPLRWESPSARAASVAARCADTELGGEAYVPRRGAGIHAIIAVRYRPGARGRIPERKRALRRRRCPPSTALHQCRSATGHRDRTMCRTISLMVWTATSPAWTAA